MLVTTDWDSDGESQIRITHDLTPCIRVMSNRGNILLFAVILKSLALQTEVNGYDKKTDESNDGGI